MLIRTSKSLHYPITVTELLKHPSDTVERFQPLFTYVYKTVVTEGNEYGEEKQVERTFPARFESETDGVVLKWRIGKGDVLKGPGIEVVEIEEPCRHEVQFGGMCAICGKDMTEANYTTSRPDTTRASINMVHGNTALRVSQEEAARVEQEAKRRLLKSKKLSLVVDLDQTIIHATVDPTVAEWQNDTSNPNYDAVKDVEKFQLVDDHPSRGCWYYIKLRPGLKEFLQNISKIYELHIYTMGTRAYALNIAKIVDPEGKIFGDRILSRDESGSLTAKNLQRLFPVDTKMVVIIDDRGDVWNWSDNLIKVKPYDFFVGIGDINSSFLPKREELAKDDEAVAGKPLLQEPEVKVVPAGDEPVANGDNATLKQLVSMGGASDPDSIKQKTEEQEHEIAAQMEDRPLLKKQKMLDDAETDAQGGDASSDTEQNGSASESPSTPPKPRHNLLQDNDSELEHLERALRDVHSRFYANYAKSIHGVQGGRIAELRGEKSPKKRPSEDLDSVPDVKEIMPDMKQQVFKGVEMVFSGVVPLGTYPANSDIGRWARTFGATITTEVHKNTTHVIATKNRRTAKVRVAARNPRIRIVTTQWLFDCVSQWRKLDETPYLIEVEPEEQRQKEQQARATSSPAVTFEEAPNGDLSSSEEDADALADGEGIGKAALALDIGFAAARGARRGHAGQEGQQAQDQDLDDEDESSSLSPADNVTDDQWQAMMAEIDEASDTEDGGDLTDGDGSESDASTVSAKDGSKKRKRGRDGESAAPSTDGEEDDVGAATSNGNGTVESKLQQRKRRALERTSSLTNVKHAKDNGGPPPSSLSSNKDFADDTTAESGSSQLQAPPASEAGTDDGDDGFNAALQAELEAQLNAEDDD